MIRLSTLWRPFHSWIVTYVVAPRPWLMGWLPRWYRAWYFDSVIFPRLMAAQADGTGIFKAWAEPGTATAEVGQWFEECITTAKNSGNDYGLIRLIIAHCTAEKWRTGGTDSNEQLVLKWEGMAGEWWAIGYPLVLRAASVEHNGLYMAINITGMWFSRGMDL